MEIMRLWQEVHLSVLGYSPDFDSLEKHAETHETPIFSRTFVRVLASVFGTVKSRSAVEPSSKYFRTHRYRVWRKLLTKTWKFRLFFVWSRFAFVRVLLGELVKILRGLWMVVYIKYHRQKWKTIGTVLLFIYFFYHN